MLKYVVGYRYVCFVYIVMCYFVILFYTANIRSNLVTNKYFRKILALQTAPIRRLRRKVTASLVPFIVTGS